VLKLNQIYLGDSYELIRKIPDKSIDLIYTDIPYFYKGGGAKVSKLSERKVRNKEELINISSGIDYSIFDEFIRILKTINICIWCSREQMLDIMNYLILIKSLNITYHLPTLKIRNYTSILQSSL